MPVVFGKAPGKIIIFGEHAVVYGQPAIAIPVHNVQATARVMPDLNNTQGEIHIQARDIGLDASLTALPKDDPIRKAVTLLLEEINVKQPPALTLQINATIPVAAGMGSGAAVTVAILRVLSNFLGHPLPPEIISTLAFEVEKIHHGTPSGIDNSVITYGKPVYYIRGQTLQTLKTGMRSIWVIADTGIKTPTRETVNAVREAREKEPEKYETLFNSIGRVSENARHALAAGDLKTLGRLLDENQTLLDALDVSHPALDELIETARETGAFGAKLSGGGRGGNMIALVPDADAAQVSKALLAKGAVRVITTHLEKASA
jgi:mevalonate kinase